MNPWFSIRSRITRTASAQLAHRQIAHGAFIERSLQNITSPDSIVQRSAALLNSVTGYDTIIQARAQTESLDNQITSLRDSVKTAQKQYELTIESRAQCQRDINALLERKASWTPSDVASFTELYKAGHQLELEEKGAKEQFRSLTENLNDLQVSFLGAIRERYSQEQLWSDKIRRLSTWYTIFVVCAQLAVTAMVYGVLDPKRREQLVIQLDQVGESRATALVDFLEQRFTEMKAHIDERDALKVSETEETRVPSNTHERSTTYSQTEPQKLPENEDGYLAWLQAVTSKDALVLVLGFGLGFMLKSNL